MLSIFNNGSSAWILLVFLAIWIGVFGSKAYRGHMKGYHRQNPDGSYTTVKTSLMGNQNFWFTLFGIIGITVAIFVINADYRKVKQKLIKVEKLNDGRSAAEEMLPK